MGPAGPGQRGRRPGLRLRIHLASPGWESGGRLSPQIPQPAHHALLAKGEGTMAQGTRTRSEARQCRISEDSLGFPLAGDSESQAVSPLLCFAPGERAGLALSP